MDRLGVPSTDLLRVDRCQSTDWCTHRLASQLTWFGTKIYVFISVLKKHEVDRTAYPLQRYGHSKFSQMAADRHLEFALTENSTIRSANPKNSTVEPNIKSIRWPVAEILQIFPCTCAFTPYFYCQQKFLSRRPYSEFIFKSDYGSIWLSFRDGYTGQTTSLS